MERVIVVMPAYYAAKTLAATLANLPSVYDEIILCDDGSNDGTSEVSQTLGILTLKHPQNRGYGANQKTLYEAALSREASFIIMVHPDNQYNLQCLPRMLELITSDQADLVLGSRIKSARQNGMPVWKYLGNRFLTGVENIVFRQDLSEFHSGLRVYRAALFQEMPYLGFSDDFVFDSEVIAWFLAHRYRVREVDTDCYYNEHASSLNFLRSVRYGFATLKVLVKYLCGNYG